MIEYLSTLLQLMLTALGAVPLPVEGMLGLAAALIAVTILTIVISIIAPQIATRCAARPGRAIDSSIRVTQSHPDADGHPRPRAPGVAPAA